MNYQDYDAYQAMQDQSEARFMELRAHRQHSAPPAFPWGLTIAGIVVTVGVLIMFYLATAK